MSLSVTSVAQNFNLSKFTNASGLPQNYVYSVAQDADGYIWIAMAEGLSRYNGISFTNYTTRDSLGDVFTSKLLLDSDNRLWCGHGNGTFSVYQNDHFSRIPVDDVSAPIKDMCLDDRGNIWAIEQNKGIIKIAPDKTVTTYFDRKKFGRRIYYSIKAVNSMTLLVGTSDGAMLVRVETDGTLQDPQDIDELPTTAINCIAPTHDRRAFWIGTDDGQIFRYAPTEGATQIQQCTETCSIEENAIYDIRTIYEDEIGDIYFGTWGEGLKKWSLNANTGQYVEALTLNEINGLDNNFVQDIAVDREGVFWFATYGGGVVAWINNYFAQYNLDEIGFQRNKVTSAYVDDNNLWMGLNNGIIKMNRQCVTNFEYHDTSMGLPEGTSVTAICFDKKRNIQYFGTDNNGVYYKQPDSYHYDKLEYSVISNTNYMINGMAVDRQNLYLATQGGFIVYDLDQQSSVVYTTADGLPHNNINFVYIDNDRQVWLGPKDSGIVLLTDEGFEIHRLADIPVNVAGMTYDNDDRMWLATVNNGVLCSENDSVIAITTADGLEKNYCYGIAADGNGRIWVCHQPGLSCIDLNTGNIRSFNITNGVGQEFVSVNADAEGDLWFASSAGVMHYMSKYDKRNNTPPIINMSKVTISGKRRQLGEDIDLPYPYDGNVAKFEFDFIGICMKDPQNVRYEYWLKMEGNENERWMPLGTQSHKEFDFLPDGDYTFYVRAFNSDGIMSEKPLAIKIHIDAPFWKSIWFPVLIIVLIVMIMRVITKWRERKLKERQKELEDEVNRQTAMLNKQKTEIERKNKDIMDSINYAKRIQTAILPTRTGLEDYPLNSSFILYLPRDVVSGDFYWFNRFDDKLLICCGDCTGHGVPGAFMSMIGTTILNEATRLPEQRKPANLLVQLDKEVKSTLNKNQSVETADGMDCAIIEIDLNTHEVRSAAARRPIYFFIKGKITEVRGTKRSIGDRRNGNEFVETVTQLHPGDSIYMSSDGFSDQFGGEEGNKYTGGALKRFIEKILDEPLYIQQKLLEEEYNRWKTGYEQIDDVIIMGIRI